MTDTGGPRCASSGSGPIRCSLSRVEHRGDVTDFEGRPGNRPFSRDELQVFFDYADEQTTRAKRLGRKGWLAAFRDATLFKTLYGWGCAVRRPHGSR